MDNQEKLRLRNIMAARMQNVADELDAMFSLWWVDNELESDFLSGEEYPFDTELEELIARIQHAVEKINENNEWLELKPITLKVSREEYAALLAKLEEPAKPLPRLAALLREDTRFN